MARNRKQTDAGAEARSGAGSLSWLLVVVAVALVATVIFATQRRGANRQAATEAASTPAPSMLGPTPVPAAVMKNLEEIPTETWTHAGTDGASMPTFVGDSDASGGKPVVLYIGAGYCPYCAAARWSMITSLSRFGSFSGLTLSASSTVDVFPGTPTFSFHGGHYTSEYIELQTVELANSVLMSNGRYQPLETPTTEQEALIGKYDYAPYVAKTGEGGIPFVLVGGAYMWSGSPFSPQVLANRTQAAIAATLPTGTGAAAQAILANANVFTATICAMDGNRPADVCSEPAVQRAMSALPRKAPSP